MYGEWVSVKDKLPIKAAVYLTYYGDEGIHPSKRIHLTPFVPSICRFKGGFRDGKRDTTKITHWMMLPEAPSKKKPSKDPEPPVVETVKRIDAPPLEVKEVSVDIDDFF